jgi:hypothetical protein
MRGRSSSPAWSLYSARPCLGQPDKGSPAIGAVGARRFSSAEEGEDAARRPVRGRSSSPAWSIVGLLVGAEPLEADAGDLDAGGRSGRIREARLLCRAGARRRQFDGEKNKDLVHVGLSGHGQKRRDAILQAAWYGAGPRETSSTPVGRSVICNHIADPVRARQSPGRGGRPLGQNRRAPPPLGPNG